MLYLLFLVLLCPFLNGQSLPGARQNAICNSDAALSDDVFSIFNNPAGIGQLNWREAGIYYSPSPYGLKELAVGYLAYTEPTSIGSFSAGIMNYGYELYSENNFLLVYSTKAVQDLYIGLAVNYNRISIKNYGTDGSVYINAGMLAHLSKSMSFGFSIRNLNHASIGEAEDQLPVIFNAGFSYNFPDILLLHFSVRKDLHYDFSLSGGIEYLILGMVSLRSGLMTQPVTYSGGIGIHFENFTFDYAFSSHQELGLTHQLSFIFSIPGYLNRQSAIRKARETE